MKDPDTKQRSQGELLSYDYDRRGNQTSWVSGKPGCARRRVTRAFYPSGRLKQRTARKVSTCSADDPSPRTYTYQYDANRNLSSMNDVNRAHETTFAHDQRDRELRVNETWAAGKDTVKAYDLDSNLARRQVDGRYSASATDEYSGGRTTRSDYDPIGREVKTTVTRPATGEKQRVTETDHYPSGAPSVRRSYDLLGTSRSDRSVEERYYYDDGKVARIRRKPSSATAWDKDQEYLYDANGNRTKDERGTHLFNARDQLVKWTRRADRGGSVTYKLNGAGSILDKTENGVTTTYTYVGNRIKTERTLGTTFTYDTSEFGNVRKITGGGQSTEYDFDEFERLKRTKGPAETDSSYYDYDGLDRRDAKCKGAEVASCAAGNKTDMSYVGTSQQLSEEKGAGKDRTYDYTAGGERLGQWSKGDSDLLASYKTYGKDANGSVESLEGDGGTIAQGDRYDYNPYGELDRRRNTDGSFQDPDPESPAGPLGAAARENPFRFQGHYYDSGTKSYDMQARNYRPEIGRFLTADRLESSSGDFNLEADALTGERYAFAGGNPVNRIEFDGHCPQAGGAPGTGCLSNSKTPRTRGTRRRDRRAAAAARVMDDGYTRGSASTASRAPQVRNGEPGTGFSEKESFPVDPQPAPPPSDPNDARNARCTASIPQPNGSCQDYSPPPKGGSHELLTALGFVPGLGAGADLMNAFLYAAEGNSKEAGLSLAAATPVLGDAAGGARLAGKGAEKLGAKGAARAADDVPQFQVRNAGTNRAGTRVPESFDLDVAGSSYHVHPNATKHLAEYARKYSSSGDFPVSPIAGAVEQAQRQGLHPGRNFGRYGNFEIGIDTTENVIYHVVYRPRR